MERFYQAPPSSASKSWRRFVVSVSPPPPYVPCEQGRRRRRRRAALGGSGGGGGGGWDLTSNFSHSRSVPWGAPRPPNGIRNQINGWGTKKDGKCGCGQSLSLKLRGGGKAGPVSNWDSGSPCQQALPTFSTIFEQGGLCLCFVICTFAIAAPPQLRPPSPFLSDFFPLS